MSQEKQLSIIEKMQKDYFRMLIMGETASGKSYFLKNTVIPNIFNSEHEKRSVSYDMMIVFTRDYNKGVYEQYMEKNKIKGVVITEDKKFLLPAIDQIKRIQSANVKEYDKEGHPIYNHSILMIFDDILDEKIMKQDEFLELFVNMRHMQISIILISQITNKAITTQMKANTQFNVMFNLGGFYQQVYPIQLITEAILKKDTMMKPKIAKELAHKLYQDQCVSNKYGYIIIDNEMNMYNGGGSSK